MAKHTAPRFKSWSPSRLDDYERCPYMAKLKHLDKLCTKCFKGKIMGGYETPAICDTCGETIVKGAALERGTEVGKTLEDYVKKVKGAKLHPEIRHQAVKDLAAKLRKTKGVECEFQLHFDRSWNYVGNTWCRDTWLIVKMDVFYRQGSVGYVIDWKTGGLDKKTGAIRANDKYDDQLAMYNTAALSAFDDLEAVAPSRLVFVDCGPRFDPVVSRDGLVRKDLKAAQAKWTRKALSILSDDTFAPRSNGLCGYCDYGSTKSGGKGPCKF